MATKTSRIKSKAGRAKTISEKLDQRNRIADYIRKTRGVEAADRFTANAMKVGSVIGNMSDRMTMRGIDWISPRGMNTKVSFKNRTNLTQEEYDAAMAKQAARNAKGLIGG